MKIKKLITLSILLILSSSVFAGGPNYYQYQTSDWYIGTGTGKSSLNYDVNHKVNNYLTENNYKQYTDSLSSVGTPLSITSELTSAIVGKLFIGVRFAKNWRTELTYKNYGAYTASVSIEDSGTGPVIIPPTSYYPHTFIGDITANALVETSASAKIESISLSVLYDIFNWKNTTSYVRFGAERATIKYTSSTRIKYQYSYSGIEDLIPVSGSDLVDKTKSEYSTISGTIPVFGLGLEYNISKSVSFRGEVERSGDPKGNGTHSDFYSIGIIHKF